MGYQLSREPEYYIRLMIVYSYVIKWLNKVENGYAMSSDLDIERRNLKAITAQGGVKFLYRKLSDNAIHVRFQYKNTIHNVQFEKSMLIVEAKVVMDNVINRRHDPVV